jgi:putative membrane protein
MWHWGWAHSAFGFPFLWIGAGFRLLFLAAIVAGAIYLVRSLSRQGWRGHGQETALDILQKRYARGEITKEEYEEMRKNLG